MAAHMTLWATDQWYKDFVELRRDPLRYLSVRQATEDTLLLDILQALCKENIQDATKIHLLGLLQEHSSLLFLTNNSVEEAVGSLLDMYCQSCAEDAAFFRGQILVTITSIVIQFDFLKENGRQAEGVLETLLDTVCKVNSGKDWLLRGIACECLMELETAFPCILSGKLDYLYDLSQREKSTACQGYILLFSTALRNSLEHLANSKNSYEDNTVTDWLCNRSEPLKPFHIPEETSSYGQVTRPGLGDIRATLASGVHTDELKKAVSYLMDNSMYLTTPGLYHMIRLLVDIVKTTTDIQPLIFKSQLLRHLPTMDLPMFQILFILKLSFDEEILTEDENEALQDQLLVSMTHPCLASSHRFLLQQWLLGLLTDPQLEDDLSVLSWSELSRHKHRYLFPDVFDGVEAQLKKLQLLNQCVSPEVEGEQAISVLMGALMLLHKKVSYGVAGRPITALLSILYQYFTQHPQTALQQQVHKLLLEVVIRHPKFSTHVFNFVDNVQQHVPESKLPEEIFLTLTEQTLDTPLGPLLVDLHNYLSILQRVSQEQNINPLCILELLQRVLEEEAVQERGDWHTGNAILNVCRSVLQHHNSDTTIKGAGDLLHAIFSHYPDIDVKDQAVFYYNLLLHLSTDKLSAIFQTADTDRNQRLASIVSGSANFPSAPSVLTLPDTILELTRVPEEEVGACIDDIQHVLHNGTTEQTEEVHILEQYREHLKASDPKLTLQYYLHFTKTLEEYHNIFTVVLHVGAGENYEPIEDLQVALLTTESSGRPGTGCEVVQIEFNPRAPVPGTFEVSALFTSDSGRTCFSPMRPLQLNFADLFLPLPLSAALRVPRSALFCSLWDELSREGVGVESLFSWQGTEELLQQMVNAHFNKFIVSPPGLSDTANTGRQEYHVGIFLPPRYHILLKLHLVSDRIVISIATDCNTTLPLLHRYLSEAMSIL